MESVFIGARSHAVCVLQPLIGKYPEFCNANGPQTPRMRPERIKDFFGFARTERGSAKRSSQFRFVKLVIPTEQDQNRSALDHINERLDLAFSRNSIRRFRKSINGQHSRSGKFFWGSVAI